jgi:tetratricopeptide (TPR) repeat protein
MFQAVVGVDPDNAKAWFNLGAAHMALRRYRDAAEMCDEAAERARKAGNAALEAKALEWRGRAQVKAGTKK